VSTIFRYSLGGSRPTFLQQTALVADAQDNLYYITTDYYKGLYVDIYTASSGWSEASAIFRTIGTVFTSSNEPEANNIAAVFCDSAANSGAGRLLVAAFNGEDGEAAWVILNCNTLLNGGTYETASGTSPSWLVASSSFRNSTGTGLSLATDAFGGTQVGAFSWSSDGTPATRMAKFTVGASISSITTDTGLTAFDQTIKYRGKVVGVGENAFVGAWKTASGVMLKQIGVSGTQTLSGVTHFDIAYYGGQVWVYYWSGNDLMRRPYNVVLNTLGTAQVVLIDAVGTKSLIRTPKKLRNQSYAEVHYIRST
jgi:hypothetical protein